MRWIFLTGKDWSTRALLRAELREDGVHVDALEDSIEVGLVVEAAGLLPSLIVADLSSSDDPEAETYELATLAWAVPIWIIAGSTMTLPKNLMGGEFEKILFKPLDAGELVKQINQRLDKV
ncbi:MAG: hypothetical protein DMG21_09605 [Acidobacteria bacterium]|nr:MAG: hypothetical protein DMG21_09605 [Acidobacteriota bacterium]